MSLISALIERARSLAKMARFSTDPIDLLSDLLCQISRVAAARSRDEVVRAFGLPNLSCKSAARETR